MKIVELPHGVVVTTDQRTGMIRTRFPDGEELVALAQYTDEDEARARALGYHGDRESVCWKMHEQHDLLHHLIAQAEGWPYSQVLYAVAREQDHPPGFGNREERLAFLLAAALNADRIETIIP